MASGPLTYEVHQAGPVVARAQRCVRCGFLLVNARGLPGGPLRGWEPGASVLVVEADVRRSGLTDEAPTCGRVGVEDYPWDEST